MLCLKRILLFHCHFAMIIGSRKHAVYASVLHCRQAYYSRRGQEIKEKWPDCTNPISTCLQLLNWTLSSVVHFIQWNETNFISFLFCRVDEFHTRRMKNERVATFCTQAKQYRCLVTNSSGIINLLFHVLRDNNARTLYSSLAFLAFDDPVFPRSCGARK